MAQEIQSRFPRPTFHAAPVQHGEPPLSPADGSRVAQLNMGQLADYVSMVGLAQIRLDANTGTAPTILGLFRESDSPPQGLSVWDRSFLEGLYSTDQSSVLQVSAIKARMVEQIIGR